MAIVYEASIAGEAAASEAKLITNNCLIAATQYLILQDEGKETVSLAQNAAKFQKDEMIDQANSTIAQGITGMIGGAFSIGAGIGSCAMAGKFDNDANKVTDEESSTLEKPAVTGPQVRIGAGENQPEGAIIQAKNPPKATDEVSVKKAAITKKANDDKDAVTVKANADKDAVTVKADERIAKINKNAKAETDKVDATADEDKLANPANADEIDRKASADKEVITKKAEAEKEEITQSANDKKDTIDDNANEKIENINKKASEDRIAVARQPLKNKAELCRSFMMTLPTAVNGVVTGAGSVYSAGFIIMQGNDKAAGTISSSMQQLMNTQYGITQSTISSAGQANQTAQGIWAAIVQASHA